MSDDYARFSRYVASLTDAQVLTLNKIVSRRAALIYAPMYADRYRAGLAAAGSKMSARAR